MLETISQQTNDDSVVDPAIEEMFKAGVHFAYKRTRRHPKMREFIAGVRSNVEVFQLERVYEQLLRTMLFLEKLGEKEKKILWVGTKPAAAETITAIANELGHPYVAGRWLGGTLTNFKMIRGRVEHMEKLEESDRTGELEKYTKQERFRIKEEIEKLRNSFNSLRLLKEPPSAMIVVDSQEEVTAVTECTKLGIPIIAIMNSDCNPSVVAYAIPANDNAPRSVQYLLNNLRDAYMKGKKLAGRKKEEDKQDKQEEK